MTKEEIAEELHADENITFLEPCDVMNNGILGITEDHKHLIYGYYTLAAYIAEDNEKQWNNEEHEGEEKPDFMTDAFDWLDFNLISYPPVSPNGTEPLIIYELYERLSKEIEE